MASRAAVPENRRERYWGFGTWCQAHLDNITVFHQQWGSASKKKKKKKKSLRSSNSKTFQSQPSMKTQNLNSSTEQFYVTQIRNCEALRQWFSFMQQVEVSSRGNKSKNRFSILNRFLITPLKAEETFLMISWQNVMTSRRDQTNKMTLVLQQLETMQVKKSSLGWKVILSTRISYIKKWVACIIKSLK